MAKFDYGMFIMPFHPPTKPLAKSYEEDLELIVQLWQNAPPTIWMESFGKFIWRRTLMMKP